MRATAAPGVAAVVELADGVVRLTFPLPLGIDHVHCYLLRARAGSWILVDTGLGLADPEPAWTPVLERLDAPVEFIVVTHSHPDHVGGAADVAALTGAAVLQGALDHEQCVRVWGDERTGPRLTAYFRGHGMPADEAGRLEEQRLRLRERVHFTADPVLLEAGEEVDGWRVLHLPGHADGHICLLRDGVLVGGDVVLVPITPTVGLFPDGRSDPLADYLETLGALARLDPSVTFAGHGVPIERTAARAEEIVRHHDERLSLALRAVEDGRRSAYEVSRAIFGDELAPVHRRFALAESIAHLEHLVCRGRLRRGSEEGRVLYEPARSR